ncbi:molybdopterin oxidoreductase [Rhodococcus sp. 15-725-2-2b]|uniref:molybdopterin-containing oxidoreductase family protein n=1 Tax=unclassified Rhodococcus (in: high G+C Gram-positive bacteria) TaxID=192944 RepID=UPI000B9AE0C5|nr:MULTISPECIES: molybdopterin-dependent oxidoreductase [unclassified Rhodococcus (in: high G+C Gram-positive bacteria)]OZC63635.1 molybdopterin oxidoreductase [Rhodococcus sp. 06-469-3-2]OZD40800.1 molybdopterin oxidoreductase [Rhodococcus sp. 06-1477-1A]OZE67092.1 molybdopterin oxidoreductase [Rhodococcus sp. 15-725-2-2b]
MTTIDLGVVSDVTTVRGACPHDCPDTCAMLVTVENGVATKVKGDPDHPYTRGGLCTKVNDFEKHAYDPSRVLYPMRRTGPKGSGEFARISWDDAITEICAKFTAVRDEFGGEAIMPHGYLGNMGILNGLNVMDPFMHKLGATVTERSFCTSCRSAAYVMTQGPAFVDPENLRHSKYIILWGHNMISSNLHLWPFVQEAQRNGAKVVVIDPYMSKTAARADWHLRINPGTDGALALAMMNVIIQERLTDDDYIADHTLGFDDLAVRAAEYSPERVADITGITADDIRQLAREYAATQPAAIRVGVAVENHPQGGQAFRAIFSLPAITGAYRHVGGGVLELTLWAFPVQWETLSQTDWIKPGTRVINGLDLGKALTGELELDPPVKALMVVNGNPVITSPEQNKIITGMKREDLFTVVSELYMTDTAMLADIVLPATTSLEHFDLMWSWGQLYITVNNKSIEPLGEAVPNIDLFRRLAAAMGYDDKWFSLTDDEILALSLDWDAPQMAGITLERLKREGWSKLTLPDNGEYAPHAEGGFPNDTGKVELSSATAAAGNFILPVFREGYTEFQTNDALDPLPSYVVEIPDANYPLRMVTPRAHSFINSQYSNMPKQLKMAKDQHAVIHSEDAADRNITDGQKVRVFNDAGSFEAIARVSKDVVPMTIVAPYGYWNSLTAGGSTVNALSPGERTDIGGGALYSHSSVEVEPAVG